MKIEIASCTREPKITEKSHLLNSLCKHISCNKFTTNIKYSNKESLTKCYNEFINTTNADILVLVHDDVFIDDINFIEKLEKSQFDITGLAGTSSYELKSPAVWNNSDRNKWSGAVAHSHDNKTWMTPFGNIPQRCIIVDGLFMALNMEKIRKTNTRFDERFSFHHYDMDFCLTAHNNGLTIGTAPIWVTHHSIGDWRNNEEWKQNETKFLSKWNKNI